MPGRIPWERISGDDVETIIAVYVCRENPDAVKVRPSRGDGGIDLLHKRDDDTYDVYKEICYQSFQWTENADS